MSRGWAERALGLGAGELRPLIGLTTAHAALGGAIAAGDATVQSVFLARAGADLLPVVLLARALALPIFAAVYARVARGRSSRGVLATLALLAAIAALGERAAMGLGWEGAVGAYVMHEIASALLTVHWGVHLLGGLGGERALRGVSLVYAGARLGGALAGGLVVLVAASPAGAPAGMFVVAGAFGVVFLLSAVGPRGRGSPSAHVASTPSASGDPAPHRLRRRGPRSPGPLALAGSPLVVAIIVATVVMVLVRYVLRYQQQAVLEGMGEVELARMLGLYTVGANVVAALMAVLLMGRILPRLGLARTNAAYAFVLLGAQAALLLAPGVGSALFARFADGELKHTLKTPVSTLFYEAVPAPERARARALVLGLASPVAQASGALLLAGIITGASLLTVGAAGAGLCVLFAGVTALQNRRYARAMRDSLAARKGG